MLNACAGQTQYEANKPPVQQKKKAPKKKAKVEVDEIKSDGKNRDQSNKGVKNKPPNKKGNTNLNPNPKKREQLSVAIVLPLATL